MKMMYTGRIGIIRNHYFHFSRFEKKLLKIDSKITQLLQL